MHSTGSTAPTGAFRMGNKMSEDIFCLISEFEKRADAMVAMGVI